jgi:hypothetical protein
MNATAPALGRLLALGLLVASASAWALPPGIYASDETIDTSAKNWEPALKKSQKRSFARDNGKWHFYYVAFLNKPAPTDQLNIVFYDAKAKGKQEPNAYPINTTKGAKILSSEVTVSPEDGTKPGTYNVRITLLANGKEQVLAATRLDLK